MTAADEKHQIIIGAQGFGMGQEQATFKPTIEGIKRYLDLMKEKVDSMEGRRMYSRRMWTIEPVFGNITSNKGLTRLSLRGEKKCTAQWLLFCLVHNIEKLWKNTNEGDWLMN